MTPLKREVDAVAALLLAGDESPDSLAKSVIKTLDELRAERTTWGTVYRLGHGKTTTYVGTHMFSTKNQAIKSVEKDPRAGMATAIAVVPFTSAEGLEQLIVDVDAKPESKGDWLLVQQDREAFKAGRKPTR